jgi:hypothetical protein
MGWLGGTRSGRVGARANGCALLAHHCRKGGGNDGASACLYLAGAASGAGAAAFSFARDSSTRFLKSAASLFTRPL